MITSNSCESVETHIRQEHHMTQFLLASGSPRRRELFALLGLPFDTAPAGMDESPHPDEPPAQMVVRLSQSKASAVSMSRSVPLQSAAIVIAADTTVSLDGTPWGKPTDEADAGRILRALRGRTHQVHTAITLLDIRTQQMLSDLATTDVPMRDYDDGEISAYIATGDPFDKAGAYAIQHDGFHPVAEMRGCFANVMGLPLCHLTRTLRALGIEPPADVPTACQSHLRYECPVFAAILAGRDPR
jgi:septum formation protein